jgi:hypothetical protein
VPFIQLNRQFVDWGDKDPAEAETRFLMGRLNGSLGWPMLLEKHRVVILAEAGSGKSEELAAQAELQHQAGNYAFCTTVQEVARDGLPGCLGADDRTRFEAWKASESPAWIFVDSVDEAKLDNIRLETALRKLADGIEGAAMRVHVILSGRYTDWEFRADLSRVARALPVPRPVARPAAPGETLLRAVRSERPQSATEQAEAPLVVLMAPLDPERVRQFAAGNGLERVDQFITAIDDANLWSLAARPLDLLWLVDYWRRYGRVGRLAEMLDTSLTERLREPNHQRYRYDEIPTTRAMEALERIGAALDFGRTDKIIIPDSQFDLRPAAPDFDLAAILPDWSPEHRQRLLSRAVFDPATFGSARLHNDNQGVVRSYLAARWLRRRRHANASVADIFHLIFATTYGVDVVRPSMTQTAAWLSIWDEDVAREVIARDPRLLLQNGDPASLSLTTRGAALKRAIEQIVATGDRLGFFVRQNLRRLSTPDMVPCIRSLWEAHKATESARLLLLLMIEIGRLEASVDIALEAVFGSFTDRSTLIYGVGALVAIADDAQLGRLGNLVKSDTAKLPGQFLWTALGRLVPQYISVDELLGILSELSTEQRDEHYGLQIHGPELVARLTARADVERLLIGLMSLMGPPAPPGTFQKTDAEEALTPGVSAAARRLLELARPNEAPEAAIDATLRLGEDRLYRQSGKNADLQAALHTSAGRRRAAFWRAAEQFTGHFMLSGRPVTNTTQLEILGWSPRLRREDLDWVLSDFQAHSSDAARLLALDAALNIWRNSDKPDGILDRIRPLADRTTATRDCLNAVLSPRPISEEELRYTRESQAMREQREAGLAERDRGWAKFVDDLRANPEQLRHLAPPTRENVDGRLYDLWQLLRSATGDINRYAIDDVKALEPMIGSDLTAAFREALIGFWRQWRPQLVSERAPDKRNNIRMVDWMGITAVSVEAKATPDWPSTLTSSDASRAAQYGTLELNGFPPWFGALAAAWRREVAGVLVAEVRSWISMARNTPIHGILQDLVYGPQEVAAAVFEPLFEELQLKPDFPPAPLSAVLEILSRGMTSDDAKARLAAIALDRFGSSPDEEAAALYLSAAFETDPVGAIEALTTRLDSLDQGAQARLGQRLLPRLFGELPFDRREDPPRLPFEVLERLIIVAFQTVRVEEDTVRPGGVVYSPDDRDRAQEARSNAFSQFANTPGRATFAALNRLAELRDFAVGPQRLRELALARAAQDSEHAPWPPSEPYALEQRFDVAPTTPRDLQETAARRLSDIQHALLHGDFAQGRTVKQLPNEKEVQKWVATELRNRQGRAYSVEREPHVVDEKEPDIRLRAKASDASLPIEVKVPESWSLAQLEQALKEQLAGRYLRAQDAKHGILLLVHKQARPHGWVTADGSFLTFEQVVVHLRKIAEETAGSAHDAPQALIDVIDVSGVAD